MTANRLASQNEIIDIKDTLGTSENANGKYSTNVVFNEVLI